MNKTTFSRTQSPASVTKTK